MKQEHRFCAEVYHRLHDQIDHDKRVLFCLDGAAAREAAKSGVVECATIPDLCFTFEGADVHVDAAAFEGDILAQVPPDIDQVPRHAGVLFLLGVGGGQSEEQQQKRWRECCFHGDGFLDSMATAKRDGDRNNKDSRRLADKAALDAGPAVPSSSCPPAWRG